MWTCADLQQHMKLFESMRYAAPCAIKCNCAQAGLAWTLTREKRQAHTVCPAEVCISLRGEEVAIIAGAQSPGAG